MDAQFDGPKKIWVKSNLLPGERLTDGAAVEAYMALMKRCWAQAPEDRPTFEVVASELRAFVL